MLKLPMLNKLSSVMITSCYFKGHRNNVRAIVRELRRRVILKVGKYPAFWGFPMHFCMYRLRELWNRDRDLIYQSNPFSQQVKNYLQCRRCRRHRFDPQGGKIPWRRECQPTPVFFPRKAHRHRSLVGYST